MEPEPVPVMPLIAAPPTAAEVLTAAIADYDRLTQLLGHFGADVNIQDYRGCTALHLAVRQGIIAAVDALLDQGADIEVARGDGKRPLYLAVEAENVEMVAALLGHGAVTDADAGGLTALHEAVRRGNAEVVRLLLDYGADVNGPTADLSLREPLFLAVLSKKSHLAKLLLDRGADPDSFFIEDPPTALHLASHLGDVEAIRALLDGGVNVDARDFDGATPLFRAVESGHLEAVEMLLQGGASARFFRQDGCSVLDLAEGNEDMLELLQGETIWKGPRIGGADGEASGEEPEPPFTILKPSPPPAETERDKIIACQGFEAIVVDFYTSGEQEEAIHKLPSVYELLYSHGPEFFKSTLEDRVPDFTWYHLPANNMVWVETLVRRIAAEKGGISTEMYDDAKVDLDLAKHLTRTKPQPAPSRLSTLRSYSRRVPGPSPISVDGVDDVVVSFVPYLHYETYHGYEKMNKVMDDVIKGPGEKSKKKRNQVPPPPPPPGWSTYDAQSRHGQNHQRPDAQRQQVNATSSTSMTISSSEESVVLNFRTRTRMAFSAVKAKLGGWLGSRKPGSFEESVLTNTDLERQPEHMTRIDNETTSSRPKQAGGDADMDRAETSQEQVKSTPPSEKSLAPAEISLPASRQSSMQQRGSTDTYEREKVIGPPVDVNIPNDDATPLPEPEQRSHFDQTSRSSRRAPTIPPPKRMQRRKVEPPNRNLNEHLVRGYYQPGKVAYQPRRTLDQYGYADIETTSHRDDDQVVYRHTSTEPPAIAKIFMVDQLWIWILGKDTIITCSALRWHSWVPRGLGSRPRGATTHMPRSAFLKWFGVQAAKSSRPQAKSNPALIVMAAPSSTKKIKGNVQSRKTHTFAPDRDGWPEMKTNDPLNIAQRVTKLLSRKGRPAVGSVHGLASIITTCYVDVFDPHQAPDDYLFFDFFERSIGKANDLVARYLREFKESISEMKEGEREDVVLDITDETELMIEVEDILDELHTLKKVLNDQESVIADFNKVLEGFTPENQQPPEVGTRTLRYHLSHLSQMEDAAKKADISLHRLMDLKQKQASLAEARYARESARDTARQGKTVIVFTVVTIIFLPVSFIAAVFSIDTDGYPLKDDKIPFDYVMKYILTIGLALSIPLIIIAFNVDRIAELISRLREFDEKLWQRATIGSIAMGILAAILTPVWTSDLAHGAKVATTVVILMIVFGAIVGAGIWRLVYLARHTLDVDTVSSVASS